MGDLKSTNCPREDMDNIPGCYGLCGYIVLVSIFLKEPELGLLRGERTWAMNWTKSSNIIRFTVLLFAGMTLACFSLLSLNWSGAVSSSLDELSFTTFSSSILVLVYTADSPGFCFLIIDPLFSSPPPPLLV